MKTFLLSVACALFAISSSAQSSSLTIYNYSATTIYVKAGAFMPPCTSGLSAATGLVAILPGGGMFSFAPLGPPSYEWYGVKAINSLTSPTAWGAFYSPCNPCGIDNSSGLNISWDTSGGCFMAKIY